MPSPALPGLFFCLAATALLIVVTVSTPIWNSVSFLDADVSGREIHFGVFGYTGSAKHLGYDFAPALGFTDTKLEHGVYHNLTKVLILHPVAAALAALATLFGICGTVSISRVGTIFMSLSAALATLVTLVIWIIDMILWGIVRNRVRDHPGATAQYGNANWLTLAALVALVLGFCSASFGSCGRFRRTSKV